WDPTFKKIIGNVADSWEIGADGKEYTFKLHPGLKWSDGHPFTADDVVFAVEDVLNNTELTPVPDAYFGGATAEKIDDFTVKLSWDNPKGLVLTYMATRSGLVFTSNPKHYMTQFHKKYTPDVEALAKSQKFDEWIALYQQRGGDFSFGSNPEKPSIYPWLLKTNTKTQVTVERNPYYWKVDPEGSQLPYMDGMVWSVVTDPEVSLLKATNGEVDFAFDEPVNKPVLADGRQKGAYRFFDAIPALTSQVAVYLNLTHKNPVMREIINNKDFRIGLSYAINRKDIINAVMQRQAEPWQIAPRKEST
ncbi:ABC transporter substrate-binding protein, partial [Actinopolymorpha sp. B17G11]|uniref:ABC transporter substrate-binding protein n=1 Tax=Actinopolymorpha sp. B17G11 TaxID=3160861 RepID=UPI0032E4CE7F